MIEFNLVPLEDIPKAKKTPTDNLVEIYKIFNQMEKVCSENNGIGLSAVQVGIPLDLFIVSRNSSYEYYLNCCYSGNGEFIKSIEGCLSIRKGKEIRRFEVERHSEATITGKRLIYEKTLKIEDFTALEKGLYSIVFQHEIEHSYGVLISHIGKEIDLY